MPAENQFIFQQLVYFIYKDGAEMTTLGGIILDSHDKIKYDQLNLTHRLDFVVLDIKAAPYSLVVPPLTYKELSSFLNQMPTSDISTINLPGFDQEQIKSLEKLYRYYPFYLEASTFN